MNKWRMKHADWSGKAAKVVPDGTEVSEAAEDIYSVAAGHRDTVIAKDKAAKARRKKGRG
jgi:hypothetical protein